MKKIIAAVTVAAILCGTVFPISAHAEYDEPVIETIAEEYAYTSSVTSSLVFYGSTAYCNSTVRGNTQATRIEGKQILQKKVLWWWSDVDTWYEAVDSNYLGMHNQAPVTENGTYRVRIEARVYSGNNYEDVYCNSTEVDYP